MRKSIFLLAALLVAFASLAAGQEFKFAVFADSRSNEALAGVNTTELSKISNLVAAQNPAISFDFAKLPCLEDGSQTMQASTYDTAGGNADMWGINNSDPRYESGVGFVIFDKQGPGEIERMWFTTALTQGFCDTAFCYEKIGGISRHGKIRFYFDNSTTPRVEIPINQVFCVDSSDKAAASCTGPFQRPLVGGIQDSSGGYYSYVPIQFNSRLKISVEGMPSLTEPSVKYYQAYHNITYKLFPAGTTVTNFSMSTDISQLVSLWNSVGQNPNPAGTITTGTANLNNSQPQTIFQNAAGLGTITGIELKFLNSKQKTSKIMNDITLKAYWDNETTPSLNASLGMLFNYSLGTNNYNSLPIGQSSVNGFMYLFFPMPFRQAAKIELLNNSGSEVSMQYRITSNSSNPNCSDGFGYFKTQHKPKAQTTTGTDWKLLDEPSGKGKAVGIALSIDSTNTQIFEGDERAYINGSTSPAIHGTGTEDFFNSGWYWVYGTFSKPSHGIAFMQPFTAGQLQAPRKATAFRHFLQDPVFFNTGINYGIEHGPTNNLNANYESIAFYYKESTATTLPPATPSSLTATAFSPTQIKLDWVDNSNNETGFKIEKKTSATGTYTQIAAPAANAITYTDSGLTPNTIYYYKIMAYNSAGNSAYSNEAYATTQQTPQCSITNPCQQKTCPLDSCKDSTTILNYPATCDQTCVNGSCQDCPCTATEVSCLSGQTCQNGTCCGNDIIEGSEVCDGTDLAGQTCITKGFTGGTLSCNLGCTFNVSACTRTPIIPYPSIQPVRITAFELSPETLIVGSNGTTSDFNVTVKNQTSADTANAIVTVSLDVANYELTEDKSINAGSSVVFFLELNELDGSQTAFENLLAGNYALKATLTVGTSIVDSFERNLTVLRSENNASNVPELPLPLVALIIAGVLSVLYFKRTKH